MAWYKPWRRDDTQRAKAEDRAEREAALFAAAQAERDRLRRAEEEARLTRGRSRGRSGQRALAGFGSDTVLTSIFGLLGAADGGSRRTLLGS